MMRNVVVLAAVTALLDTITTSTVATAAWAPLLEDNVYIRTDIVGLPKPGARSWSDSYSDGNSCYCATTFDHNLAGVIVETPLGNMTMKDVCDLLGPGPTGSRDGRPLYNDIQCGNGPSVISDEVACPGRTEYGAEGCKYIGPKWNFTPHLKVPIASPTATTTPVIKAPMKAPIQAPIKVPTKVVVTAPTPTTTSICNIKQIDLWDTMNKKVHTKNVVNHTRICQGMEFSLEAIVMKTSTCSSANHLQFVVIGPNRYRYVHREGQAPYCMYGNTGTTIHGRALSTLGIYHISVTPHSPRTNSTNNNNNNNNTTTISVQIIRC
jgi:hypothetical protein